MLFILLSYFYAPIYAKNQSNFVAKAFYSIPTTSDLIRALQATKNLRRICGFSAMGEIPSETTFSRSFAENLS
jgi:hypothetical protein